MVRGFAARKVGKDKFNMNAEWRWDFAIEILPKCYWQL